MKLLVKLVEVFVVVLFIPFFTLQKTHTHTQPQNNRNKKKYKALKVFCFFGNCKVFIYFYFFASKRNFSDVKKVGKFFFAFATHTKETL